MAVNDIFVGRRSSVVGARLAPQAAQTLGSPSHVGLPGGLNRLLAHRDRVHHHALLCGDSAADAARHANQFGDASTICFVSDSDNFRAALERFIGEPIRDMTFAKLETGGWRILVNANEVVPHIPSADIRADIRRWIQNPTAPSGATKATYFHCPNSLRLKFKQFVQLFGNRQLTHVICALIAWGHDQATPLNEDTLRLAFQKSIRGPSEKSGVFFRHPDYQTEPLEQWVTHTGFSKEKSLTYLIWLAVQAATEQGLLA